ncbi:PAS domain-containing protein [Lasiodiplodia theobromae]|uniref:PAS domain-containing protein n=1 Tax=Lasiodiplodia theobromae TaxID=45133 RepID=UPI0015C3EF8D|nr:PAS domain-containing protein [Lasiodiplodia theobromae]KAF4536577.1 PAS domain-containing protein [Lasiodiplodia theobromae]
MDDPQHQTLAPPKVAALRLGASHPQNPKVPMERTVSQNIRDEMEELKEAAEQTLNVLVDLNLDGTIRSVSPSWREVVGSEPDSVIGKPIDDLLLGNKRAFTDVVETMRQDDARSRVIRFSMKMGPFSKLRCKPTPPEGPSGEDVEASQPEEESEQILNLEAQGIMSYNPASGDDCHTMWMMRPSVVREVTIDLPEILVESLGVGAEVLARYLTELAEAGTGDPSTHPPPPPVLCRICERHITPWWFEKHTDLCLQEHKAEMEVQMAQEALTDHRNAIVKVLDALEATSQRQTRAAAGDANQPITGPPAEYKGLPISPASTPSSGVSSGRASPASPPSRSRDRSTGLGHRRARSFAVRRPLSRIVELVLDLCDTALEINTPAIKDTRGQFSTELRTQSPQSENRISQVLQWQSPNIGANDGEQGLSSLCEDTAKFCRAKVDAIFRYRRILEYSERIRVEFEVLVQECVEAAISKAASIARGELSDSTDTSDTASQPDETPTEGDLPDCPQEEGMFSCSLENPSAMNQAFRNSSEISLASSPHLDRRPSSAATSTRSSSPRGSQTPRSHAGAMNIVSHSKRTSMHLESDAGADSDSSVRSSVLSGPRRADSPGSEVSLSRVASSRERKRRSLILPSVMSSRQQSPARAGPDSIHSPITSPVLSTSDFSSPALAAYPIHHHRRQSSTAGSDIAKPPVSPRLIPSSNPQPRAVPPSIKDFEIIKPISKGAFGSVYLSKKKSTGDYFAIKVLKKADMVAKNQVTNVKAERAIMMWQGESDFVAKLYWTFSSKDYLYLVMEYLNGGDCASLIKVLGALPEDWAKKYLAEVVLGVEHLHSRGIVHRDLKPDNLLIDQKGHLKLTDFGLSRMGLIGRQKRALNSKSDEQAPDLLKGGPFHRALSVTSSRSASFDAQGSQHSPQNTPSLMPALSGDLNQPSYFSLSKEPTREPSRRTSNNRSDSGDSDALQTMFRRFSIADDTVGGQRRSPIDEEVYMSEDGGSPDPYALHPTVSHSSAAQNATPPQNSGMLPPPLALFDPEDSNRRFVGTPDYLAPETINGSGQDEVSDWWSLGCILFECLYGYPPFHAETPDEVFQNILERKIDWPPEDEYEVSEEATDLMNRLMCTDPAKRLGANIDDKFSSGGEEIKNHPWFADINWDTLREDEASFVPASENPEDTEYFDSRGATMQNFAAEFEDQAVSSSGTPGADYPDRPHDALSRVRSQVQVNSVKRSLMPLHIPPHVREGRSRRLSEPMATDDFGAFAFKNLPVLEKANKDVIQKLRAEAMQAQSKTPSTATSPSVTSPTPSLESSPMAIIAIRQSGQLFS